MNRVEMLGYIKDNDPEYETAMEKKRVDMKPSAYGESELKNYRKYLALQAQGENEQWGEPLEKKIKSSFEWMRKYMARDLDDVYRGKNYQRILNSALADPQIGPGLAPLIATEQGTLDIEKTKTFLNDWENHNDVWAKVLEHNISEFQERAREIAEKAEQARQEFLIAAREDIETGKLPVAPELLQQRVDETVIYVRDHVKDSTPADYTDTVATISGDIEELDIKHAVFHELTHALSGRIISKKKIGVFPTIDHVKEGLMFTGRDAQGIPHDKRRWLSEALTERQTLKFLRRSVGSDAKYPLERAGLETLFGRGISENLMYRAYYENYNPDTKGLPVWKELIEEFRRNEEAQKQLQFLDSTFEK